MPKTPLVNPREYYESFERPSLPFAAGIVIFEALAMSVILWVFLTRLFDQVDISPAAQSEAGGMIGGAIFGIAVGVIVGWLLLAVILHVFVWFADGEGGFGTTLAVVGEAELVTIALLPMTGFGLFAVLGDVPTDPAAAAGFIENATTTASPITLLTSFVGFVWQAVIQGIGLAVAHDIPVGKMLTLTFVVGFLGFLFSLV
ncbi:YIP1 family protein [Halorhabdus amylolytica]|uniref:YIP1 family protein n=1 Tax=Halorhabdus amylolytica TaxID=2559573 RepID=UPI0010AB351B|nr:YIP1 family protein [Halorhabdus amylolytica]